MAETKGEPITKWNQLPLHLQKDLSWMQRAFDAHKANKAEQLKKISEGPQESSRLFLGLKDLLNHYGNKNQVSKEEWESQYSEKLNLFKKDLQVIKPESVSLINDAFELFAKDRQNHIWIHSKAGGIDAFGDSDVFVERVIRDLYHVRDVSRDLRPSTKTDLGIENFDPKESTFLEISSPLNSTDDKMFVSIYNQGIDSHLEGFTKSHVSKTDERRIFKFHQSEIPVLLRRLRAPGTEERNIWADDIEQAAKEGGLKFYTAKIVEQVEQKKNRLRPKL